ncbi:MAG TPA: porin [Burkholderiales bacterium]
MGALASPLAFAQNVTLYGGIDVGLQHADSGQDGAKMFVTSGSWYTSRIGFKASDDIGPGLSAILVAESGIAADTGGTDSAGFWQRQVYGGLDSKQWGALTIGRQYTHMHNQSAGTGSLLATTLAGTLGFSQHLTRASNAIKYSSANYGGINFGALYGFGENEDFSSDGNYWEAHIGYAMKPFAVDFAHARAKSEDAAGEEETKRNQLVGKWDTGAFGVAVGFATDKADDEDTLDRRVIWVQPGFRFGGNNELYVTFAKAKDKTDAEEDATWYGASFRHLFTKRTYAYATFAVTKNDNGAGQRPFSYAGPVPAGDEDAKGFGIGIAQEF